MPARTLLGISPGTRLLGLAVLRKGELVEWRVKTFRNEWSKEKQDTILATLERLCDYHAVTAIAIKKVDPLKSSPQLDALHTAIVALAQCKGIEVTGYSLADLDYDVRTGGRHTRGELSEQVAERHPELKEVYLRERNNRREYYTRMFEAIAMAEAGR